jgi:hypothetical protein
VSLAPSAVVWMHSSDLQNITVVHLLREGEPPERAKTLTAQQKHVDASVALCADQVTQGADAGFRGQSPDIDPGVGGRHRPVLVWLAGIPYQYPGALRLMREQM